MCVTAQADIVQHRHSAENLYFLKRASHAQFGTIMGFEGIYFFAFIINIALLRVI